VGLLAASALTLTIALPLTASAQDAPLLPLAHRLGYEFDRPQILLRQQLFGLAHGASLLAAACLERADQKATDAYANWHEIQEPVIRRIAADLAEWHFGARASEAGWNDIARAIGLRDALAPRPEAELADACATLPEALPQARYDIGALLIAVPPEPTFPAGQKKTNE
jgi:hypothetical protein